jgi:Fe-S cluster biogenesis protein NfuA
MKGAFLLTTIFSQILLRALSFSPQLARPLVQSAYSQVKVFASTSNNKEEISKAPTFNGQVVLPLKAVLPGLKPHKVAAVYAIYSEYNRADKEAWGKIKHIDITKDLYSDLMKLKEKCADVNYVKALSFAYPQKSAMQEVADRWIALMVDNGGQPGLSMVPSRSAEEKEDLVKLMIDSAGQDDSDSDDEFEFENSDQTPLFVDMTTKEGQTKTVGGISINQDSVVSPFEASSKEEDSNVSYTSLSDTKLELTVENVNKVLDEIRPYLISDGGNVSVKSVDTETKNVYLVLEGACGSCSSSTVTMSMGITRVLRENFVDIGEVIQVEPDSASNGSGDATELTLEAVQAEINRIGPAITAMGGQVDIVSVDPIGVVEVRFRGANKVKQGLELALRDVRYVKHVKFVS